MAQRKRPLELAINERTAQLLEAPIEPRRGRVRPRRIDPATLPTMPYRRVPTHVTHPVPPVESDFWKREE